MQSILENNQFGRFTGITIGKVYKLSPAGNMVDIMLLDGTVLKDVQVTVSYASSRCGSSGLPISEYEKDMKDKDLPLSSARIKESDVYAVVGFLGGSIQRPICLGFLFPEENEVLCGRDQKGNEDGTQYLWKHESNVYVRVAKTPGQEEGSSSEPVTPDIEISHPSGLFIKIGRNAVLEPITNWDKDIRPFKKLNPKTNEADEAPFVHLEHPSGTYITIDDEGSVEIYGAKDMTITVDGDVTEEVTGTIDRTYHADVTETFEANWTRTIQGDSSDSISGDATRDCTGTLADKGSDIQHLAH